MHWLLQWESYWAPLWIVLDFWKRRFFSLCYLHIFTVQSFNNLENKKIKSTAIATHSLDYWHSIGLYYVRIIIPIGLPKWFPTKRKLVRFFYLTNILPNLCKKYFLTATSWNRLEIWPPQNYQQIKKLSKLRTIS